jgi:nucleoside-diphosphate-sugar epimerase
LLSPTLAKRELGWEPEVSIENGIQITADWLLKNCLEA